MSLNNRQILVFLDGTLNAPTGGAADTNVVRLHKLLAKQRRPDQVIFYCPGVGRSSLYEGFGMARRSAKAKYLDDILFGNGVIDNIVSSYEFISRNYKSGDEIYIFGFSRGGFSAIKLIEFIKCYGLISPDQKGLIFEAVNAFLSPRNNNHRTIVAKEIRELYGTIGSTDLRVKFLGVWDAVAAVGLGRLGGFVSDKIIGAAALGADHIRNAVAINEYRRAFRPILFEANQKDFNIGGSVHQRWFPGCHADVGGGYPPQDSLLSRIPLKWMLEEARSCGLRIGDTDLEDTFPIALEGSAVIHDEAISRPFWAIFGMRQRSIPRVKNFSADINSICDVIESIGQIHASRMIEQYIQLIARFTLLAAFLQKCGMLLTIFGSFWVSINLSKLQSLDTPEIIRFNGKMQERLNNIKDMYSVYSNPAVNSTEYCENALKYVNWKLNPPNFDLPFMDEFNSQIILIGRGLHLATLCLLSALIFAWHSKSRPIQGSSRTSHLLGLVGPLSIYNFFSSHINSILLHLVDFKSSVIKATLLKHWLLFDLYVLTGIVSICVVSLSFSMAREVRVFWMQSCLLLCGSVFLWELLLELSARILGNW